MQLLHAAAATTEVLAGQGDVGATGHLLVPETPTARLPTPTRPRQTATSLPARQTPARPEDAKQSQLLGLTSIGQGVAHVPMASPRRPLNASTIGKRPRLVAPILPSPSRPLTAKALPAAPTRQVRLIGPLLVTHLGHPVAPSVLVTASARPKLDRPVPVASSPKVALHCY